LSWIFLARDEPIAILMGLWAPKKQGFDKFSKKKKTLYYAVTEKLKLFLSLIN
jgi:hypothetical protein